MFLGTCEDFSSSCCTCSSCIYFMRGSKFGGNDRCCIVDNPSCCVDYPACFCDNYVDKYEGDE